MIAIDYVGVAGLVTSCGTVVIGVIVAWRQTATKNVIDHVKDQVTTPSNGRTLGEIVEANDLTKPPS